jgi:hypothetical protein
VKDGGPHRQNFEWQRPRLEPMVRRRQQRAAGHVRRDRQGAQHIAVLQADELLVRRNLG